MIWPYVVHQDTLENDPGATLPKALADAVHNHFFRLNHTNITNERIPMKAITPK